MWSFLGVPASVRRLLVARVVGATVAAVVVLSVASWVIGDITRKHALGRLNAEIGLVTLQADVRLRETLEGEAIGGRRVALPLRRELVASDARLKTDRQLLGRAMDDVGRMGRIERAFARHDRALQLELAAIERHQIPLALRIEAQETDPAARALDGALAALRIELHRDSLASARLASVIGWMKAIVTALVIALLVRLAARSRARGAQAEAEREALSALNSRLLEVDQMKDDFIATVSHELRTPLTSIRGYLELVDADEGLSEEARGFISIIDRNSERLEGLVTDLLCVAQADADEFALKVSLFHPRDLVNEAVASAQPFAAVQQITLTARADDTVQVAGDRARLAQLLDNLISNALKFTPPGGSVNVQVTRTAAGSTVFEIADTGIGIPEAEQGRTFERFYRATAATKNVIAGTGLGLAIVKMTAEAHGGTVALESVEGEGTTFRVVLPLPTELVPLAV
jgi:signal transduction histidine kinase